MELLPGVFCRKRAAELAPARVPEPHADHLTRNQNPGLKSIVTDMIDPHKDALTGAARRARCGDRRLQRRGR